MDFDAFTEEVSRKIKKKKLKVKSLSSKKQKEVLENVILDDECTSIPQMDVSTKVYK
ncbi:MAG TPA: hypothetical protein VI790_00400 [Candidatus Nanoarchaeia archaeon]|nr:hypothetical protein [Candidatus Nanoarchaeia archaeon]